ncbi:hypothetical protein BDR04DRAFT_1123293 [Suillus decipiens]|nr:hypothetical protein BDR04DRAFT_1123293 [Suillus decipiens]
MAQYRLVQKTLSIIVKEMLHAVRPQVSTFIHAHITRRGLSRSAIRVQQKVLEVDQYGEILRRRLRITTFGHDSAYTCLALYTRLVTVGTLNVIHPAQYNGSGEKRGGCHFSQIAGRVGGPGSTRDHAELVDGSSESDAAKEQRRVRAAGKRKAHEDFDPKGNLFQLSYDRPPSMPSHISLGAPVPHKSINDLAPTFLVDAKVEVKRPNFIRWFIATFPYKCSACVTKKVSCGYPPVADGIQRRFTCTTCCGDRGVVCSWLQDLLEVYIRETYQLDVGEARVLASSKGNDPQGTLSSYYKTWLAEPAGCYSDGELRERLKALKTIISSKHPKSSSMASSAQRDALQMESERYTSIQLPSPELKSKPRKRVKLMVPLSHEQLPQTQAFPSPPQGPSTPASVQISPGGSRLPPTTPDRASPLPPPSTPAPVHISPGPNQPPTSLANSTLVSATISPHIIVPATITISATHTNAPQNHVFTQMDGTHSTTQHCPGDKFQNAVLDTVTNGGNAGTDEVFASADPRPPCDIDRLTSDMISLSDGLAKLVVGDPFLQQDFSNRQQAESYLLNMVQGSLQTCDFLRNVVDEKDSRHITITRRLEDRIRLLMLENGHLKQGATAKYLERKIHLLGVENDQLRSRLVRQDQELEDGRLQGRAVKGLEQRFCQLEAEKEKLRGKLVQQEQAIAIMKARTQLADCMLQLTSRCGLLSPGDTQTPDPVMAIKSEDLVSMVHAYLDGVQPSLANKRSGASAEDEHRILSK